MTTGSDAVECGCSGNSYATRQAVMTYRPLSSPAYKRAADRLYAWSVANSAPCGICLRCTGHCGVCLRCNGEPAQPIDYTSGRGEHRLSYTYGHIVQRDAGGHLTDPANAEAQHRVCNARDGARYSNDKRAGRLVKPIRTSRQW